MYSAMDVERQDYYIKPMNCPFHLSIYNPTIIAIESADPSAEIGCLRFERSGVLHGLMRVRGFTLMMLILFAHQSS
jgi:threonyl-tRNA synthetase